MWFLLVLLVIILIIAFMSIKIVKQSEVYIIESNYSSIFRPC